MRTIELSSRKPKLCVECAHCVDEKTYVGPPVEYIDGNYHCDLIVDVVTGSMVDCETVRTTSNDHLCGAWGRLWQPKLTEVAA